MEAILNIINKAKMALSQAEIQEVLPDGLCNRVTTYRVLNRLVNEKLVHQITNMDGVVKYANCLNCSKDHKHEHLHFSCEKCNAVTCIEGISPSYHLPKGYKVNKVNFMVSGICPKCMAN